MSIGVGDLVMVVRWPHEHKADRCGAVFCVGIIWGSARCPICSEIIQELSAGDERGCVPFSWLKKIEPLETLEGLIDLHDVPVLGPPVQGWPRDTIRKLGKERA